MLQAFFKPSYLIGAFLWGIGLYVLIKLGVWQVQRLEWKSDLEQQLQAQILIDAAEYPTLENVIHSINDETQPVYRVVKADIQAAYIKKSIFVGPRLHEEMRGYHLYTPLMMKDGFIAYAHLGWVSMNYKQAFQETSSFNTLAPYDLAYGYIAPPPRQSRFGRTNAPLRDIWTQVDLNAFFNQSGLQEQAPLLPYIFVPQINDQNQAFNPLSWISSKTLAENEKHYVASKSLSEIELRNNHFQYLMFWFAMALIWGGFGAYGAFRIVRARRAT